MLTSAQNASFQTTQTGFSVAQPEGWRAYRDDEVLGFRVCVRRESDLIGDTSIQQSLELRLSGDSATNSSSATWVTLSQEVGPFDEDRLGGLRDRLLDCLFERACERLELGEDIRGEGWTLSLIGFTDHATGQTCFPQQICRASWEADDLCLWHEDEAEPFARYPRAAENSLLLYRLLGQFLEETPGSEAGSFGTGLGKRLSQFTTYHRHPLPVRRLAIQMSLMLAGLMCCMSLYTLGIGLVLIMIVVVSALPLLRGYSETLKHFERGLVWSCGSDERILLFDQLESFAIEWRDPPSGEATRRVAHLRFLPEDLKLPVIGMELHYDAEQQTDVDAIQTHAAAVIAERMRRTLSRHGRVDWTTRAVILRNGLEDHKSSAGPIRVFPFTEIDRWVLDRHQLTLWLKDQSTVITYPTNLPNFYAGMTLLQMQGGF